MGRRAVLLGGLPHGRACCAGAGPAAMVSCAVLVPGPPPWSGVLCWCVALLRGWASCADASFHWSGVPCWCVTIRHGWVCCVRVGPAAMVGCAVLVLARRHALACCAGVWCSCLVGRAVQRSLILNALCCAGARPATIVAPAVLLGAPLPWWSVLCLWGARRGVCAWCGGACLESSAPWQPLGLRVWVFVLWCFS